MSELDQIEARLGTINPGPWEASRGATADGSEYVTTKAQKADFLALSLNDEESHLWLVVSPDVIPAATGDGPRAKANAEFIANAPADIEYLLTLARKQAAALERVVALHKHARTDVEPWAKGYRYSGDHCAFDGEHWPCATVEALEPTP